MTGEFAEFRDLRLREAWDGKSGEFTPCLANSSPIRE